MRSRGIQAGDLVQVVHDCCGSYVGLIYTVRSLIFVADSASLNCQYCGWHGKELLAAWNNDTWPARPAIAPAVWLRKFEPPAESISEINRLWEPRRETIKVPR
jgi:hypothetical protein